MPDSGAGRIAGKNEMARVLRAAKARDPDGPGQHLDHAG